MSSHTSKHIRKRYHGQDKRERLADRSRGEKVDDIKAACDLALLKRGIKPEQWGPLKYGRQGKA